MIKFNLIYSHHIDCENDHIEVLFKIISNKIEKTNSFFINFKLLKINKETKETWNIPYNNYIDICYIIKEEKKIEKNNDILNKNNIKLDFDKSKKLKNSVLYKKINLNLNINKSNTFMSNNSTSPNNNNKIKLKKYFFNYKESKSKRNYNDRYKQSKK